MATIQIHGVRHQRQLNPRACWYTCLQMAVRYFENKSNACAGGLSSPENFPNMQQRFTSGGNPTWAEWRQWAQQCGFTPLNLTPNQDGVYQYLSIYGPIVYSGTWGNTFDGHVVILTGVNTDAGTVFVDDPIEASAPVSKNTNTYFAQLTQSIWETPLFVYG